MWDNPRQLNLAANALVGLALLLFAFATLQALLRSPAFPLREVVVPEAPRHAARVEIEAAVEGLPGNFFAVDLGLLRQRLEQVPWVRRVEVRRAWPDRIEIRLEEHVPLARWGDTGFVNTFGEPFVAALEEGVALALPLFAGPAGTEREVARRYARFREVLAGLAAPEAPAPGLSAVVLTARHAWQLRLANGLQIELGRDGTEGVEPRLARFVAAYPETLGKLGRRVGVDLPKVDLRYPNGFALRVMGLKG